jgi:hypothetical protein
MKKPGRFAFVSTLVLAASLHSAVHASHATLNIFCPKAELAEFCEILSQELQRIAPKSDVVILTQSQPAISAQLTLQFQPAVINDHTLSGTLTWTDPKGRKSQSPSVELNVLDTKITAPMLREFASQLIRLSDLPL